MDRWLLCALVLGCAAPRTPRATLRPDTADPTARPLEAAPAAPAPGAPSSPASRAILDAHNRDRAAHCAPPLVWSPKLASVAQAWADHLRDTGCRFEHSHAEYGENLAMGSTGTLPPEAVVAMWYREGTHFDFAHGGFSMDTGHFTQLVWRSTHEVGCGMSQCRGMDIWVCNYDPAGNMEGAYRDNVRPSSCRKRHGG